LLAEQLAYVSNSIPQQVWTATPDGMLDFVNEKTIQYFGKPIDEITGENWIKLVHPADLEVAGGAWMHSLTTGETYQTEFRLLSKDEKYVWHLARAIPVIEAGKIVKWFGTNTDIEEQKQLEQHKNDFISIASHELKTPITTLKMSLQLLDKIKNNPPAAMLIKLIEQSNRGMQKLSSLVDDLLSVSRMKEGQLNLNKMTFNLAELLRDSCSYAGADGMHEIIMECGPELSVFADAHLIEQVVVNFVNNAVKYAPESKEIYVVAEQGDNFVKISVNDTGPGISADKVPHLFDRYYRADHSGRQYSGLGLGLYISSEIIKRHSGQIGVDSEVGKGSKFWFTLPANG
jgi:two-component system sensor histidine kinase VicK